MILSVTTVVGNKPNQLRTANRLDRNSHQVVMYRLVSPIFKFVEQALIS